MDDIEQLAAELHADETELQSIAESLTQCSSDPAAILSATRLICSTHNRSGLTRTDVANHLASSFKKPLRKLTIYDVRAI